MKSLTQLLRARREMMERAAEQNLAYVQGDEYYWKRGCGPEDVDWDRPMEDELLDEDWDDGDWKTDT
jgi:hypothetical protein